jgi:hypothetical protein
VRRDIALASALPVLIVGAILVSTADAEQWLARTPLGWRGLANDLLLAEAALLPVGAPIVGVGRGSCRTFVAALCALLLVSAAISTALLTAAGSGAQVLLTIPAAHATLAATVIAMGTFGRLCAAWFRDPLDAAGVGILVAVLVNFAVLAGGPATAQLPTTVINSALAASPSVATMTAAGVDILRAELLYSASPIAHLRFEYPNWFGTAAAYALVAALCLVGIRRTAATAAPPSGAKGAP